MEWRTISVALQVDSAGYIRGVKQAADATKEFGQTVEKTASSGVWDRFKSKSDEAFGSVWKWTKRLASGALLGGLYKALTGGWQRFTTIEDATAALTVSLGDATKAADLLDDVLSVVSGTPFNLDQFASAAQLMAGMGVEANKIPGYLEAIGEAAATQGGRAGEMAERLSTIFGEIQSRGNITTQHINRISQTGVNALVILANEYGVTTQEMQKMVTKGMVPAERAMDALSDGIINGSKGAAGETRALGGTMEGLRETLSGSAGGLNAALARFGASMIEAFSPGLVTAMNTVTDILDELGNILGPVFSIMGKGVKVFAETDWAVRGLVIALGGLAALKIASVITGFVNTVGGKLSQLKGFFEMASKSSNRFVSKVGSTFSSSGGLTLGLVGLGGALAIAGHAWSEYQKRQERARQNTKLMTDALIEGGDAVEVMTDKLARGFTGGSGGFDLDAATRMGLGAFLERTGLEIHELVDIMGQGEEAFWSFVKTTGASFGELQAIQAIWNLFKGGQEAADAYEDAVGRAGKTLEDFGSKADYAEYVFQRLPSALRPSREAIEEWIDANLDAADATGEVAEAALQLSPRLDGMSDAFGTLADETSTSADRLSAWMEAANAIIGITKSWEDAQRDWKDAIHDATEELKESEKTIDLNSEAGRENHKVLSGLIDEALKTAEAFGVYGNGAEDAAAMLGLLREDTINALEASGWQREEAAKAVNQFGLTEESVRLLSAAVDDGRVNIGNLREAFRLVADRADGSVVKIDNLGRAIVQLPSGKRVTVDVYVNQAALDRVINRLQNLPGVVGMYGNILGAMNARGVRGRWGGVTKYAQGGIHPMGLNHRLTAQIGSGRNQIWWDEPETGGEAYIPRLGSRQRSTEVLSTAASWYGMRVVPMASGGVYQSEVTRAPYRPWVGAGSGGNVTHFNGGVHISEDALGVTSTEAAEIARQVFQDGMRGLR